jgi:hypothetical protein
MGQSSFPGAGRDTMSEPSRLLHPRQRLLVWILPRALLIKRADFRSLEMRSTDWRMFSICR